MCIAFVNQPWSVYPPDHSADSIALIIHELARRVARSCEVICYAKAIRGRPQTEIMDGIEIRRVAPRWDALAKPLRLLDRWKLLILYVGRLSPEKGVHVLLQAFSLISAEFPDVRLDLAGPESVLSREFLDPDRQDPILEKMSDHFENRDSCVPWLRSIVGAEAADRVRFLGSLSHDDLPGYYRASDVLVVPSIFDEPFGLPIAEGLASGLPVIATRAGAFAEIIEDGKSGILVDRDNASQLAGAIRQIFSDADGAKAMRIAARHRAESMFSWDDLAHRLRNRYEAIGNRAAAPCRSRSEISAI